MTSIAHRYTTIIKESAIRHGFMGAGIARAEHMDAEAIRLEQWLKQGYHGEMSYMANHFDMRVDPTKLVQGAKSVISLLYNYYPEEAKAKAKAEAKEIPDAEGKAEAKAKAKAKEMPDARHADTRLGIRDDEVSLLTANFSLLTQASTTSAKAKPAEEESFKISRYAYGEDYHKVVRRKLKALVNDLKKEIGEFNARVFVDSAPVLIRDWAKRSVTADCIITLLTQAKKGATSPTLRSFWIA